MTARSLRRPGCVAVAVFLITGLPGCQEGWEADYSQLDLVEVRGRITMDGRPLDGVTVIFEHPDRTYSYGKTDANGDYSLMFDSIQSGALPGPKTVRLRQGGGGEASEEGPVENADGTVTVAKDSIPPCYGTKSQLQVTLEGSSQTVNFDLKSDGSVTSPTA